jgi:hypothetical protein
MTNAATFLIPDAQAHLPNKVPQYLWSHIAGYLAVPRLALLDQCILTNHPVRRRRVNRVYWR